MHLHRKSRAKVVEVTVGKYGWRKRLARCLSSWKNLEQILVWYLSKINTSIINAVA